MNYEPMWRVVDAHRRCADELERTLKEITGDRPVPEADDPIHVYHQTTGLTDRDDIESYPFVARTLLEARDQLWNMADRKGHGVRGMDASRCNILARRCDEAFNKLTRSGEL
jgi:hypothetical protein